MEDPDEVEYLRLASAHDPKYRNNSPVQHGAREDVHPEEVARVIQDKRTVYARNMLHGITKAQQSSIVPPPHPTTAAPSSFSSGYIEGEGTATYSLHSTAPDSDSDSEPSKAEYQAHSEAEDEVDKETTTRWKGAYSMTSTSANPPEKKNGWF